MLVKSNVDVYSVFHAKLHSVVPAVFGEASKEGLRIAQEEEKARKLQKKELKTAESRIKKLKKLIKKPDVKNALKGTAVIDLTETPEGSDIAYRIDAGGVKTPVDISFLRGFLGDRPAPAQATEGAMPSHEVELKVVPADLESPLGALALPTTVAEVQAAAPAAEAAVVDDATAGLREPQTSVRDEIIGETNEGGGETTVSMLNTAMAEALLNAADGKKNQKHNRSHFNKKHGHNGNGA